MSGAPSYRTLVALVALAGFALSGTAVAERRSARTPVAPRLSEETLVPTEIFPDAEAKRFGYPAGLLVTYSRGDEGHVWRLTEQNAALAPAPVADASPTPTPVMPSAGADEADFLARVGMVRPTFVTLVFTASPEAANEMLKNRIETRSNETLRPPNLGAVELKPDARLTPGAMIYNREVNLGAKSGGMRRGSTIWFAKGNAFVVVSAFWGLQDGEYEARIENLEQRAHEVATYLLRRF